MNSYGDSGQPCFVPDFSAITLICLHLVLCWLLACCILPLLHLVMFLISLLSPRPLWWRNVVFCRRLFQHLMRWSCGVFFSSFFIWWITLADFCMLNHPWISGMKFTWTYLHRRTLPKYNPVGQTLRATINKSDHLKLRSFYKTKAMVNKTKWHPSQLQKIFPTSDRGLISKIYKELKKHHI